MAEIEKQKVDSYIETMIDSGFTYQEIEKNLTNKSDLTKFEITDALKNGFILSLKDNMKKYVYTTIILGIIAIISVFLFYYFQHKQDAFMEQQILENKATALGNGKYLVDGNFDRHKILQDIGGWSGLISIISLIKIG
jgi:hypothetical protein